LSHSFHFLYKYLLKSCRNTYIVAMKNWIAFWGTFFFIVNANAQFDFGAVNAQSEALGGIQSVEQNAYSTIGNQAGLAGLTNFSVGLSAQNRYLLEGLKFSHWSTNSCL